LDLWFILKSDVLIAVINMVNYIVDFYTLFIMINKHKFFIYFLARLGQVSYIVITFRPSSIRPSTFHILIFSLETTGPIATNLWWNGPWMAPFQNCVRWSRPPSKMAAKLKIEKRGDEILIVHCCFSISQNELKF
jgi:hypothetical protein